MKLKAVEKEVDTRELLNTGATPISTLILKANKIQDGCHDYNVSKVTLRKMRFSDGELSFIDDVGVLRDTLCHIMHCHSWVLRLVFRLIIYRSV